MKKVFWSSDVMCVDLEGLLSLNLTLSKEYP